MVLVDNVIYIYRLHSLAKSGGIFDVARNILDA